MPLDKPDTLRQELQLEEAEKNKQELQRMNQKKEECAPASKTISNGKNEKECQLRLHPNYLVFKYTGNLPGFVHFTIINVTKGKHAFKIKTNSNKMYMARPSVGYLEPGDEAHIKVTYLNFKENVNTKPKETLHVALFHKQIEVIPAVTASRESKRGNTLKPGVQEFKDAYKNSPHPEGAHHFYCTHHMEIIGDGGEE